MTSGADGPWTPLIPGTVLGQRFQVVGNAGQGGMGVAYRAQDLRTGKKVIVKVPQFPGTADLEPGVYERIIKRFSREGRLLRKIDHPNIPKVVGEGEHGSTPYIAMTYIRGAPLAQYRRVNSPRRIEFAAIGTSVATTLAACHAQEVLHRDLNPNNILIGENGVVYVIDFGIALPLDGDATRYTRNFVGTDDYSAPERFCNGEQVVQSDLYSLGCVFYFVLTGSPPFVGERGKSSEKQHLEDLPVPPSMFVNHLPRDLEELTLGLLAKNVQDRPEVGDVLAILKPYLPVKGAPEPSPLHVPDVTIPYRTPDKIRPPEAPARSRTPATQPFRVRRRHDFLTDHDITTTIQRATAQHDSGDTAAAAQTVADLRRRAIETYGIKNPKLEIIEAAVDRFGVR
ncbi:serine/threonine-protein kinase [Frankia sp. QA3]|uniref:serine/threonine protein kinase n=1 Tax=Frankia sp. QA3 TaxID=710111 RepID=UPI0018DEEB6B|nr:serine/threonine-protein kinase [Frankia sp. QA3]